MKRVFSAVTAVVILASCVNEEALTVDSQPSEDVVASGNVEGMAYVKFDQDMARMIEEDMADGDLVTRSAGLNLSLESLGIRSVERVFSDGGEFEARRRAAGLHLWYVVTYDPSIPHTKASGDLKAIDGILSVDPVREIAVNTIDFNDWTSDLWGFYNTEYEGYDINVEPVWENYTTGSQNVVVAVVDSGVDTKHPDLAANCTAKHYNYSSGAMAADEHGTHVAGTIAAVSNNGKGVCGIAGGNAAKGIPGVKITSYQIFPGKTTGKGSSAEAIAAAADHGALICQNSWGYNVDPDENGITAAEKEEALAMTVLGPDKDAIDYFIKNAGCDADGNQRPDSPMKGGLVVFAAGNDGLANGAPANYEPVIAVGAIDKDGKKADFSNYGDWVDIAAPGVDIISTVPGGQYKSMQGTSMACPHVSGVAALVLSYWGGPGFTADMLKEKILKGANKTKLRPADKIGPLLDAYGAMTYGDGVVPEKVEDLEASGRGNNIDLTWTQVNDSKGMPVYGALVVYGTDKAAVESATPQSYAGCDVFSHEIGVAVGQKASCSVPGLAFETTYYCKLYNYTYGMQYSDPTPVLEAVTTENHAPQVTFQTDEQIQIYAHEVFSLAFEISDPDGHAFEVEYKPGSDADVLNRQVGSYSVVITGKSAPEGSYTGKIMVKDQYGMSAEYNVPYVIKSNQAPEILKEIDDVILPSKNEEFRISLSEYFSDPDGEALKYDIQVSDKQVLYVSENKNVLYGTPMGYGNVEVVITASDARGETAVIEFKVLVKDPADPLSVYPNPVVDFVTIGTLDMAETTVMISSSTGKVMYEETSQVSGLEPARVDMSSYPPGTYSITVIFGGNKYKKTVVKL